MTTTLERREAKVVPTITEFPELMEYLNEHSLHLTPAQQALRQAVQNHRLGIMSASPDESQYLGWLAKLIGAKKVIEVGVFLGATTLSIALALPEKGTVVALDVNNEFTSVAEQFWNEAGIRSKIDLRIGPAVDALDKMVSQKEEVGTYDLAFIDADKTNYDAYFEKCLTLVRVGGVIAVDNVLFHGGVLQDKPDANTQAIKDINKKLVNDPRVDMVMLPIADGLTLCRKL